MSNLAMVHDVVVVGAGPAGIAAACACAEAGKSVAVVEQSPAPGGQIWRHRDRSDLPRDAVAWLERLDRSGAELVCSSTVLSIDSDTLSLVVEREGESRVLRSRAIILATGARELFLPFPGWTLPWVVGAGGAQALLKSGVTFRRRRVVVAGSGALLLPVAASLIRAGATVTHVLEQAPARSLAGMAVSIAGYPSRVLQALGYSLTIGISRYRSGSWVERAHGKARVESVMVRCDEAVEEVPCDTLCVGYGLVPSTELARAAGCDISGGAVTIDALCRTSVPGIFCAGEAGGVAGVDNALMEGALAGAAACGATEPGAAARGVSRERRLGAIMQQRFALRQEVLRLPDADTLVCRCEDVREGDIDPEAGWRELKLRTRIGMGACQGRICGAAMHARFGIRADDTRVPVFPARLDTLSGSAATWGEATMPAVDS